MKITKITTYRLPPRWMFLKIETDEGVVGWGEPVIEGRARTVEAAVHELGDYLIGQDPSRINDLWQVMYRAGFYRGGPILMSAIAGIDQALWDIKGKVLNAPVWQLMGGLVRDKIKAYSWVGGDRPADVIDGIKTLREIGFDTFKLNGCEELGLIDNSRAVDAAVNTVAQIREAFGNQIEFGLDFHGRVSAPMAKVLNDAFGIKVGTMTTIHAYTGTQSLVDGPRGKDLRASRAAAENIIPHTTGAAKAIGLVIPALSGKLKGHAQRVPVKTGSVTELVAILGKKVTVEEINAALKKATQGNKSFGYTDEEIVSSDVIGSHYGSVFDATQTEVSEAGDLQLVKAVAWYDNEYGFVTQLVRTLDKYASL